MYETRHQAPLSRAHFQRRLLGHFSVAALLVVVSLGAGMVGYHGFEQLAWMDAFVNAAMLLGGMGPVNMPVTAAGKLFAGLFALYSGMMFLVAFGLVLAPVLHRLMHRFHWSEKA
jgi:hypothetical protein